LKIDPRSVKQRQTIFKVQQKKQ